MAKNVLAVERTKRSPDSSPHKVNTCHREPVDLRDQAGTRSFIDIKALEMDPEAQCWLLSTRYIEGHTLASKRNSALLITTPIETKRLKK
jgi:hypothetical protein